LAAKRGFHNNNDLSSRHNFEFGQIMNEFPAAVVINANNGRCAHFRELGKRLSVKRNDLAIFFKNWRSLNQSAS
jgi:hypothetical protein